MTSANDKSSDTNPLGNQIVNLYAQINHATWQLLHLIARFEHTRAAAQAGFLTTANWLNWRCGIGLVAAREKARVALALEHLPLIDQAFGAGHLSYSKVRALTRVATSDNEQKLLNIALCASAAQAEKIFRQYRQTNATEPSGEQDTGNRFTYRWDADGSLVFSGRLSADLGAVLLKAMQQQQDGGAERSESIACVAQAALGAQAAPGAEADVTGDSAESTSSTSSNSAERYVVHVDIDKDHQYLRGGPGIREALLERLSCDASLVVHTCNKQGTPLNVGRKTRTVPGALRRALHKRDGGCRFPGCTHDRFVDAHHVVHWAHGGETKLSNLVLLCDRHHRLVHEHGFRIETELPAAGVPRFHFVTPDGTSLPCVNDDLSQCNRRPLHDSAESQSRYPGERLFPTQPQRFPDYGHINSVLCARRLAGAAIPDMERDCCV